jgi:hypothetical protein
MFKYILYHENTNKWSGRSEFDGRNQVSVSAEHINILHHTAIFLFSLVQSDKILCFYTQIGYLIIPSILRILAVRLTTVEQLLK